MAQIVKKVNETLNLNCNITVDGVVVQSMNASINSINPQDIQFGEYIHDKNLYKENRVEIRALEAEFEDYAFARQEEMIAAKEEQTVVEEPTEEE